MKIFNWLRPKAKFAVYIDLGSNGKHTGRLVRPDRDRIAAKSPHGIFVVPVWGRFDSAEAAADNCRRRLSEIGLDYAGSQAEVWVETSTGVEKLK